MKIDSGVLRIETRSVNYSGIWRVFFCVKFGWGEWLFKCLGRKNKESEIMGLFLKWRDLLWGSEIKNQWKINLKLKTLKNLPNSPRISRLDTSNISREKANKENILGKQLFHLYRW